ncbi:MAG: peptidoglycan D,D-transpeptidase FtsI family protein, partial [Actinomycetota bacterium]
MKGRPPAGRVVALFAVLALGFAGIAGRLVLLQVRDGRQYTELAEAQRVREVALPAERGTIFDRSKHELALSLPASAVYANPGLIEDPRAAADGLSEALAMPSREISRLLQADAPFVYLARRVDLRSARRVEELGITGVGLLDESKRYYPGGSLASQVLGFVGVDGRGLAGLELEYQSLLSGRPGSLVVEQDPSGLQIPQGFRRAQEPERGRDVVLTIDTDLQFHAERALADAVEANGARGGTVIVMDPSTGEILAMATSPGFDANEFSEVPPEVTRNVGVTDVYEPGSVNKVIT